MRTLIYGLIGSIVNAINSLKEDNNKKKDI